MSIDYELTFDNKMLFILHFGGSNANVIGVP